MEIPPTSSKWLKNKIKQAKAETLPDTPPTNVSPVKEPSGSKSDFSLPDRTTDKNYSLSIKDIRKGAQKINTARKRLKTIYNIRDWKKEDPTKKFDTERLNNLRLIYKARKHMGTLETNPPEHDNEIRSHRAALHKLRSAIDNARLNLLMMRHKEDPISDDHVGSFKKGVKFMKKFSDQRKQNNKGNLWP